MEIEKAQANLAHASVKILKIYFSLRCFVGYLLGMPWCLQRQCLHGFPLLRRLGKQRVELGLRS